MTDPFQVLYAEDLPVQPDPDFTARLRARLESALSTTEPPRPAALPYLTVGDARAAIAWYRRAFGAELVGEPIVMDDGRVGHAELRIAGGVLYLAEEFAEIGLRAPTPGATSVSLMLHVADTDTALARAHSHGAAVEREPYEAHGSRAATIRDPFGHRWMLSGPVRGPA